MAKFFYLINSNRSEIKRFMKNDRNIDEVFEYIFIDSGKIVGSLGEEPPVIETTVSVDIELAREIYERLLSQGWRRTDLFDWIFKIYIKGLHLAKVLRWKTIWF